jgi:hypothetical protein
MIEAGSRPQELTVTRKKDNQGHSIQLTLKQVNRYSNGHPENAGRI